MPGFNTYLDRPTVWTHQPPVSEDRIIDTNGFQALCGLLIHGFEKREKALVGNTPPYMKQSNISHAGHPQF